MSAQANETSLITKTPSQFHSEVATPIFGVLHHRFCGGAFAFGLSVLSSRLSNLLHHVLGLAGERAAAWSPGAPQHIGVFVIFSVWRIHQGVGLTFA